MISEEWKKLDNNKRKIYEDEFKKEQLVYNRITITEEDIETYKEKVKHF